MPLDSTSRKADHGSVKSLYISADKSTSTTKSKTSKPSSSKDKSTPKVSPEEKDQIKSSSKKASKPSHTHLAQSASTDSTKRLSKSPAENCPTSRAPSPATCDDEYDDHEGYDDHEEYDDHVECDDYEEYVDDEEYVDNEERGGDTYRPLTHYTNSPTRSQPRFALLLDSNPITIHEARARARSRMRNMFEDFEARMNTP